MTVRRFFRDLLGTGSLQDLGDDLLSLGTAAVMGRAMPLGDTLVLPGHVVLTLPAEELALFTSPRLLEGLTRSLRRSVHLRTQEQLSRLRRLHGSQVVALGGDDLRLTLVEGDVRDVEARFEAPYQARAEALTLRLPAPPGPDHDAAPDPRADPPAGSPAGRRAGGHEPVTVLEHPGADDGGGPRTEPDGGLRLVLRSDGVVVGAVFATAGRMQVGRDPASSLVVPQAKEKVSRQAVWVSRSAVAAVELEVVGRNGAWVNRLPPAGAAPGREHVGSGDRTTLRPGERVDLDRAATVTLALEGSAG